MITRRLSVAALALGAALAWVSPAPAQNPPFAQNSQGLQFNAFTPSGWAALTASAATSRVALGSTVAANAPFIAWVQNTGSNPANVQLGISTVVATLTSGMYIGPGACVALNALGATHLAGISASGTTLSIMTGTGVPAGSCGGGSGGGSTSISFSDTRPSPGNITIVDSGSSTTTGQNSASIITGTPTANSFQSWAINGVGTAGLQVSGTWTGTLSFELSFDGGTTWSSRGMQVVGTSYTQGSATANGDFFGSVAGATNFRVRATAAVTGTAVVQPTFTFGNGAVYIINPVRLWDNTSGVGATIKPASTAPLATDPALVVGINPTSAISVGTPGIPATDKVVSVQGVTGGTGIASASDYPMGATAIAAASGNVAAATASATLTGTSGKTTYLAGFSITGGGATGASLVTCTITNIVGGVTMSYTYAVVAGATLGNTPLVRSFSPPIPASASNTAIVVSCPTFGAGNTNSTVNAQGYQL